MAALAAAPANPVRSADRVCDILDTLASRLRADQVPAAARQLRNVAGTLSRRMAR